MPAHHLRLGPWQNKLLGALIINIHHSATPLFSRFIIVGRGLLSSFFRVIIRK
jgi:hypothetical protein